MAEFCSKSGQKVNLSKSKIFFSKNLNFQDTEQISQALGIAKTEDIGIYLGAPMIHQRSSKHTFNFILDKMKKKLVGWKANSLSFAGRVTLAQASLSNIPGYVIQTCVIPVAACDEAKKLCRDFIWGSSTEQRKCHLISWKQVCLPKEECGLGFRNLRLLNKAYILMLAWSFGQSTKTLGSNNESKVLLWSPCDA